MDKTKNVRRLQRKTARPGLVTTQYRGRLGRRGSVMILVIAVLVLLALLGTAFITTSRNDLNTSQRTANMASLEVVQSGALNAITSGLQRNVTVARKVDTAATSNTYLSFNPAPTSPGLYGLPLLASRAPVAFKSNSATPPLADTLAYPRWPAISAPLNASAFPSSTPYPLTYAYPASFYGATGFTGPTVYSTYGNNSQWPQGPTVAERTDVSQGYPGSTYSATSSSATAGDLLANPNQGAFYSPIYNLSLTTGANKYTWPDNDSNNTRTINGNATSATMLTGSTDGKWGTFDSARRDLIIGSVTVGGVQYPAFYSAFDASWVIAADADGDGIPDSGLNYVGPIAGAEFSGLTFYVAYRVVDNNSAINANTATMGTHDFDFSANGLTWTSTSAVRNNRIFPSSIDLRLSVPPANPADYPKYTAVGGQSIDLSNGTNDVQFHDGFLGYRSGRYGFDSYSSADLDTTTGNCAVMPDYAVNSTTPYYPPAPLTTQYRGDFTFNTQLEADWMNLGRRVDFPGMHYAGSGKPGQVYSAFSIGDQAQLAYGGGTVVGAGTSTLEKLLPFSLTGVTTNPFNVSGGATGRGKISGSKMPLMHSQPYALGEIGYRDDAVAAPGTNWGSWFTENFGYGADPTAAAGMTSPLKSLRPFLVTRNPVSQAVGFKPLPTQVTQAAQTNLTLNPLYDTLNPYVQIWDQNKEYLPGDLVFYVPAAAARAGYYYVTATSPLAAGTLPTTSSWAPYTGPIVPQKVDVNKAPFGDLWRGFFLTMASDRVAYAGAGQIDISGQTTHSDLAQYTVSPFGKSNPNSQASEELYRGMHFTQGTAAGQATVTATNFADPRTFNLQRSFRSNVKDYVDASATSISADQMVILRSAQTATNAEYLRGCNTYSALAGGNRDDIVRHNIHLKATVNGNANTDLVADVYSAGKFPYITEFYYNSDPGFDVGHTSVGTEQNPLGLVVIELYNPYPFAISLANCKIQRINRTATANDGDTAGRVAQDVYTFDNTDTEVIPAGGVKVLTNYNVGGSVTASTGTPGTAMPSTPSPATWLPPTVSITVGTAYYVPHLEQVVGYEVVLSRPMHADITAGTLHGLQTARLGSNVIDAAKYGKGLAEFWVPFDSIDLFSLHKYAFGTDTLPADPTMPVQKSFAYAYHYARAGNDWRFVYPGRYDGSGGGATGIRQQGLRPHENYAAYDAVAGTNGDDGFAAPAKSLGANPGAADVPSYDRSMPLQIANFGFGGPNAGLTDNTALANRFPFGGFPRIGDLLQVTFVSPVRLRLATAVTAATTGDGPYVDVISLTQDAQFAEDTDTFDDREENIGRFTPIMTPNPIAVDTSDQQLFSLSSYFLTPPVIDEFALVPSQLPAGTNTVTNAVGDTVYDSAGTVDNRGFLDPQVARYGWANGLFDQFTVGATADMSTPNATPKLTSGGIAPDYPYDVANYPAGTASPYAKRPVKVSDKASSFPNGPGQLQADVGTQGQININNAPLPVLAAVPWTRSGLAGNTAANLQTRAAEERDMNLRIAQAIIAYREPHYDVAQNRPLPFRPIRSLFELNRILMMTVRSSDGQLLIAPSASFRTGGLNAASTTIGNWDSAAVDGFTAGVKETAPTGSNPATTDPFDPTVSATAPFTGTAATNAFQTIENGNFLPGDNVGIYPYPPTAANGKDMMAGAVGTPAFATAAPNKRNPRGDFQSQYLMMTAVSNLITTRSDTFTAYIDVEGWSNVGTANAKRVVQHRYAYILDRNGSVVSMPVDTTTAAAPTTPQLYLYPDATKSTILTPGPVKKTLVPTVNSN